MSEATKQAESSEKNKKPRHRSPNYPGIGLRAAVGKIEDLYKADKLAPSPTVAALKHMGFDKAHGEAGRVLSALKSFGLIEETNDRIKITQRGIDIVARQEGDAQRSVALRDAAISPDVYRDLIREYQASGLPSDATLKSDLIAVRRFNPNAVDGFVREFKDTLDFAGLSNLAEVELGPEDETAMPEQEIKAFGKGSVPPPAPPPSGRKDAQTLLSQALVVSIPRNFRVDINVRGDELKKYDLTKIKRQFNRWIEWLEEAFEE